jgi:hypothetical protein
MAKKKAKAKRKVTARRKATARTKDLAPRKSPKGGVAGSRLGIRGPFVLSAV